MPSIVDIGIFASPFLITGVGCVIAAIRRYLRDRRIEKWMRARSCERRENECNRYAAEVAGREQVAAQFARYAKPAEG